MFDMSITIKIYYIQQGYYQKERNSCGLEMQ